jgi:hypothetical protein
MTKHIVDGIRHGLHREVKATQVTIAAGTANPIPTTPLDRRKALTIFNKSGSRIWVGNSDVDDFVNGYPIDNNSEWGLDLSDRVTLYAYCPSTVSGVYIFEIA